MAIFKTRCKLITAYQIEQICQVVDPKSGQTFLGNIGDWYIMDQDGNVFLLSCYQFSQKYQPTDQQSLLMYSSRYDTLKKRKMKLAEFVKQQIQFQQYFQKG